jgi:mannobiose 2-epimerase
MRRGLTHVWPSGSAPCSSCSSSASSCATAITSPAFFTERWEPRSAKISFGHDIETSWLLLEGAHALGDPALTARVRAAARRLAAAVLERGFDAEHGGLFNEREGDRLDTDKEWWPQAEAVVGFLAAYQDSGDERHLDAAVATWRFIARHMVDRRNGEWFRRVSRSGDRTRGGEKVGPWKCPYHDGRACLEVIARTNALLSSDAGASPLVIPTLLGAPWVRATRI